MVKSKALKKYYGRKAYADGSYGNIIEHSVVEDYSGFSEQFTIHCADGLNQVASKVVVMERLNFLAKNNVIVAIAVVDGRTYVGNAILNPADGINIYPIGRRLALARALRDSDGENCVLEDMDYVRKVDEETEDEDSDEDEDYENEDSGLIGECQYCGAPIYDCDNYVEGADGCLYCNNECLEEEKNELAEEETDEMEQELVEEETEEMEKELAEEN